MTMLQVLLGSAEQAAYGNDGNEHILLNREWAKMQQLWIENLVKLTKLLYIYIY
jgi:hypothetical protein